MYRKSIFSDKNDSLSKTSLGSPPVAESTHIGDTTKQSSGSKFPWGGKNTPKRKAISPLNNFKSIAKTNSSPQLLRNIDSRTYTDTQSRGLVSRIVKYHEISSAKNDRPVLHSKYSRPGEFPVVNLTKTEIIYTPRRDHQKPQLKIAQPSPSTTNLNDRASIFRNGLNMRKNEENEPLSPNNELDIAPTRSVLDALKEISRKRINNEELEIEGVKKSCTEPNIDLTDYPAIAAMKKRQRESAASVSPPNSDSHTNKRNCIKSTKSNDILSSLSSSSAIFTPKRNSNETLNTVQPAAVHIRPTSNLKRSAISATEFPRREIPDAIINTKQPTATTSTVTNVNENKRIFEESTRSVTHQQIQQPKLTLFNRQYTKNDEDSSTRDLDNRTATVTKTTQEDDEINDLGINFIKPKEKLLSSSSASTTAVRGTDGSENKKIVLSGVEKSKLSMMLSFLRGDDDSDNDDDNSNRDTVDKGTPNVDNENKIEIPASVSNVAPVTGNLITKPEEVTSTAMTSAENTLPTPTSSVLSAPPTSIGIPAISTKSTSFAFGNVVTTTSTSSIAPILPTMSSPASLVTVPSVPPVTTSTSSAIPAFSFGNLTKPTPLTTTTTTAGTKIIETPATTQNVTPNPLLAGIPVTTTGLQQTPPRLGGFKFDETVSSTPQATFSLGTSNSIAATSLKFTPSTVTTNSQSSPMGALNFTFGGEKIPEVVKPTSSLPQPPPSVTQSNFNSFGTTPKTNDQPAAVAFNFSSPKSDAATGAPPAFNSLNAGSQSKPSSAFLFGGAAPATTSTSFITPISSAPTNNITNSTMFGGGNTSTAPLNFSTTKPDSNLFALNNTLGNVNNTFGVSGNVGGSGQQTNQSTPTNLFAFGNNNPDVSKGFGNMTSAGAKGPTGSTTNLFAFGGQTTSTTTTDSNQFKFGSGSSGAPALPTSNQQNSLPSFGSVVKFGTSEQTNQQQQQQQPTNLVKPSFSFTTNNNVAAPLNPVPVGGGGSNSAFSFSGIASAALGPTKSEPVKSIFGGGTGNNSSTNSNINQPSSTFSFNGAGGVGGGGVGGGGGVNSSFSSLASQAPTFGGGGLTKSNPPAFGSDQTKSFSFSSPSANNPTNNPPSNMFGSANTNITNSPSSVNLFGGGGGGGSGVVGSSTNAPVKSLPTSNAFNFGGDGQAQQPNTGGMFNFSGVQSMTSAPQIFGGGGGDTANVPNANPFAAGGTTSTNNQNRRPIRFATRRMK